MNRCVNINHPEFKELLNQSTLDPISLAADVSIWQDRNDTDIFPTLNQLNGKSEVLYQKDTDEGIVASEKTIRDLAARMSDRIGIPVRIISDRSQNFKGKLETGVAVVNLAYASLDTPIHEILGHPIVRALKGTPELRVGDKVTYSTILGDKISKIKTFSKTTGIAELEDGSEIFGGELTKIQSPLFNNLLKELESGKGKEVLDRIKRDYNKKDSPLKEVNDEIELPLEDRSFKVNDVFYRISWGQDPEEGSYFPMYEKYNDSIGFEEFKDAYNQYVKGSVNYYTLEEQQEEAIVELLGMMTAERLDAVKDGKLISLLKRLLKEIKAFIKDLLRQREVEVDKLPDNMTLGDLADLLAYSNSKLILPGNEVVYTTPDNQTFKTYQEASNHISELAKNVQDVDLDIKIQKEVDNVYEIPVTEFVYDNKVYTKQKLEGWWNIKEGKISRSAFESFDVVAAYNNTLKVSGSVINFISKNKEYEQSKEIIEEWMKVNGVRYNPEEIYSRGQEFVSIVGAYSTFDVNLMMQNLLQHIEDNQKAGGEFAVSAITKPVDRKIGHLEGGGGKIRFKIYPQPHDILWAANADVYSGSVWDAGEKINKDKKSELLGVTYSKYPALNNLGSIKPNLAEIVDDLDHHHNELGIALTGSNFRLDYDDDIPYTTKKIIDGINRILDQKYGKLRKPTTTGKLEKPIFRVFPEGNKESFREFNDEQEAKKWLHSAMAGAKEVGSDIDYIIERLDYVAVQPKLTSKDLKESITQVKNKLAILGEGEKQTAKDYLIMLKGMTLQEVLPVDVFDEVIFTEDSIVYKIKDKSFTVKEADQYAPEVQEALSKFAKKYGKALDLTFPFYYKESPGARFRTKEEAVQYKTEQIALYTEKLNKTESSKEYTEQALINTKIAKLKEVAKKYPRALIRSEVRKIQNADYSTPDLFDSEELPFQKVPSKKPEVSDLQTIASAFTKRFGVDARVVSKEEAKQILGMSSKDMFFQILDDVDVFDNNDPKQAKEFISKVFKAVSGDEEAKKAYRKLSFKYHPDKAGSSDIMKHLNQIYEDYKTGKNKSSEGIDVEEILRRYEEMANEFNRQQEAENQRRKEWREHEFERQRQQREKRRTEYEQIKNRSYDDIDRIFEDIQKGFDEEFKDLFEEPIKTEPKTKTPVEESTKEEVVEQELKKKGFDFLGLFKNKNPYAEYNKYNNQIIEKNKTEKKRLLNQYDKDKKNTFNSFKKTKDRKYLDQLITLKNKLDEDFKKLDIQLEIDLAENKKLRYKFQISDSSIPAGFYDAITKTAYLVEGVANETTPIHEIFTHPFLEVIEKENKELYKNLLKEAYKDKSIREYVDSRYEKSQREKEYIARAIDLEATGQLQNKSLIDYIQEFWQAVSKYVSDIFGGKTASVINIKPSTTVRELVDFVLKDSRALNLNQPKPELQDTKLKSLLERTGFSLVTLSEYEEVVGKKFNVNALVDMSARLVAMADGASVSALTEELAHIAVAQSRGSKEYNAAMTLLENTEEFKTYYTQYMEEYGDDTHVREEILGKILKSDLEVKLGTSIGMWLRRLWNKFLSIFRNNDLRAYVSRITDEFIANPERDVKDDKVYFQLGEEEKTLQQQVNKLNRRYKELTRRRKGDPSLLPQIRALEEELEGNKNGVGIYKFLLLLNEDTRVAIDYLKDYFTITQKEERNYLGVRTDKETPSDLKITQLAKYIGYYLPFLKELNMVLDEDSVIGSERKVLLDEMIRIHTENFEVINRAHKQLRREISDSNYQEDQLRIAGQVVSPLSDLREAPRDSNFWETWFGLARNNSDDLVRLVHRLVFDLKNKIRRTVLNWSDDFLSASIDYIGKDMSWVAERVAVDVVDKKTGLITKKVQKSGNFIDEVHQGQWDLAREQFHTSLHDRYGFSQDFAERLKEKKVIQSYGDGKDAFQKSEIQKLKEYNQEIAKWYTANSIPNPRMKEIMAERNAALSPEQYEFWKLRNMETNPDGSVRYYKGELVSPSRGKTKELEFGNKVARIKTTDWTNKDYFKLSEKDRTFLQYLKDQKKEMDKSIPFADSNRLPQMNESTLDIMSLNEPEVFKRLGRNIKSTFIRESDDTQFNDTVKLGDDSILDDIPIRFAELLEEPDRITTDILSSLIAYKQMQENYVEMSKELPKYENYLQVSKRRVVKSGDKVIEGKDSWSFDALEKFLQANVVGKEKENLEIEVMGVKLNVTKAIEKLSNWVRAKNLGFNFIAMTSNLISSKAFATLESLLGNYTTFKSSAFANKEFFSILPTVISSFNGVRSTDRISSLMTYFGLGRDIREMFDDLDKHVLMRGQPDKTLMYGFEKGDYFTNSVVMISILDNYRVKDNKWYTAREAEKEGLNFEEMTSAYNMLKTDKDGKVNTTIPDSVIDNLTARIKTISTRVNGSLSPEDKGAIYQNAVFCMVGIHRGWLFEGLSRRLKSKGYDFTLNQITEGDFRTVMNLIGRFFMSPKKLRSIQEYLAKYNELEDYQKENLKRVMLELSMIGAFTVLALVLNSGDDDEEDYFRDLLAYQSNRVLLEVSSFYNPNEFVSAIKDPIVPARDLELVTNFTDMFNTKEIESGKWEGMTKQQKYFLQLVPGVKGFTVMRDPESQNKFLMQKPLKPIYSTYEFFVGEEEK